MSSAVTVIRIQDKCLQPSQRLAAMSASLTSIGSRRRSRSRSQSRSPSYSRSRTYSRSDSDAHSYSDDTFHSDDDDASRNSVKPAKGKQISPRRNPYGRLHAPSVHVFTLLYIVSSLVVSVFYLFYFYL